MLRFTVVLLWSVAITGARVSPPTCRQSLPTVRFRRRVWMEMHGDRSQQIIGAGMTRVPALRPVRRGASNLQQLPMKFVKNEGWTKNCLCDKYIFVNRTHDDEHQLTCPDGFFPNRDMEINAAPQTCDSSRFPSVPSTLPCFAMAGSAQGCSPRLHWKDMREL